jgi:hypothetical protein
VPVWHLPVAEHDGDHNNDDDDDDVCQLEDYLGNHNRRHHHLSFPDFINIYVYDPLAARLIRLPQPLLGAITRHQLE